MVQGAVQTELGNEATYLEIHFQSCQQKASAPRVLLCPTRPSRWSSNFAFTVVKEGNNMRIALAHNKEMNIQHFCEA